MGRPDRGLGLSCLVVGAGVEGAALEQDEPAGGAVGDGGIDDGGVAVFPDPNKKHLPKPNLSQDRDGKPRVLDSNDNSGRMLVGPGDSRAASKMGVHHG